MASSILNEDAVDDAYSLIFENDIPGDIRSQLKGNSKLTSSNRFRSKIHGFVIEDSVNNVAFPLAYPILDTSEVMVGTIYKQFRTIYSDGQHLVLPWHFIVEFYKDGYTIHATRPQNYRFPISKTDVVRLMNARGQEYMNDDTNQFMTASDNIDLREMIHIMIVGDSTLDVYTSDIYSKIGKYIISPLSQQHHISPLGNIHALNIGKKFNTSAVTAASAG